MGLEESDDKLKELLLDQIWYKIKQIDIDIRYT